MQTLYRLGLVSRGMPTPRAAFWGPLLGSLLIAGGVALWLFS